MKIDLWAFIYFYGLHALSSYHCCIATFYFLRVRFIRYCLKIGNHHSHIKFNCPLVCMLDMEVVLPSYFSGSIEWFPYHLLASLSQSFLFSNQVMLVGLLNMQMLLLGCLSPQRIQLMMIVVEYNCLY